MSSHSAAKPANWGAQKKDRKQRASAPPMVTPMPMGRNGIQRKACACGGSCPRCKSLLSAYNSNVSQPGDRHEQEADGVAEQVLRMAMPSGVDSNANPSISEKSNNAQIKTKSKSPVGIGPGTNLATAAQPNLLDGEPLDEDVRTFFEPRFGYDFSQVRVHADNAAAHATSSLQAHAYTLGSDIVFGSGKYAPGTDAGNRLIAHELVHVVQAGITEGNRWSTERDTAAQHVRESVTPGHIAREVGESVMPNTDEYSTTELEAEVERILQQLTELPQDEISPEREALEQQYYMLNTALQSRRTSGREAADVVTAIARTAPMDLSSRIGIAFGAGFAAGALMEYRPADAQRLVDEIQAHPGEFGGGILVGIFEGAASDLWSNIVGIGELLLYLSPLYWAYRSARDTFECLSDTEACAARAAEQRAQVEALLAGLGELIVLVARNPDFLVDQGEELGLIAGQRAAQWFDDDFMRRTPYEKGETVGMVAGMIIMEIALLFLGPEEWIARGLAAGGQALRVSARLERSMMHLFERVPALARLMELRRASTGAHLLEESAGAVRTGEHAVEAVTGAERATGVVTDAERAAHAAPTGVLPPVEPRAPEVAAPTVPEPTAVAPVSETSPPMPPTPDVPPPSGPPPPPVRVAHADSSGVTFSEPSTPPVETVRRPGVTVEEPRSVVPEEAPPRVSEPEPHPFDEELHPIEEDVPSARAEETGTTESGFGTEVEPGGSTIERPTGSPRAGALFGDLGEAIEAAAAGAQRLPPTHARHISAVTRADLRLIFSEFGEDALRVFVERLGLPPAGLRQVEIPVSRGVRRVDRLFVEGEEIVLCEVKNYRSALLSETTRIGEELTKDLAILDRYPYARIDWHITGNISAEFVARLEALQVEMAGRFNLLRGSPFKIK